MCLPGTPRSFVLLEAEGAPKVDRRTALLGAAGRHSSPASPPALSRTEAEDERGLRDLTHTFRDGFPVFVTGTEPQRETIADYATSGFYAQRWTFGEHSGTHMDVPGHFHRRRPALAHITLQELIVPIVVIDIRRKAKEDPNAMVESTT